MLMKLGSRDLETLTSPIERAKWVEFYVTDEGSDMRRGFLTCS